MEEHSHPIATLISTIHVHAMVHTMAHVPTGPTTMIMAHAHVHSCAAVMHVMVMGHSCHPCGIPIHHHRHCCCHIHHVVYNVKQTKQHSSPKLVSGRPYTRSNAVYVKLESGRVETELLNVVYGEYELPLLDYP